MNPNDRQWELFTRYKDCPPPMHPRDFLQRWDLDYSALARLTGVSRDTVYHWLSAGAGSRDPSEHTCRRLASIDFLWRHHDEIPRAWLDRWCGLQDPAGAQDAEI